MPVRVTLDGVLARRSMTGKNLATQITISETQLSLFRSGKVRGIRFETIAKMCAVLECQPGELLGYEFDEADLRPAKVQAQV
jgi:putative transcriptional regulator